jgi:hypothetical protein
MSKKTGGTLKEAKDQEIGDLPVETVIIASLRPHPKNYREHPDDQLEHIVESIREHGIYRNVVVAKDGTILAGHGVVLAATKMGMTSIPVVRLDVMPDDPRALKLLIGDNEIANLGEVNDRALTEMLKDIKERAEGGLLGTGYDDMMLANLLMVTRSASEVKNMDEAKEWVGMPDYEQGTTLLKLDIRFRTEGDREAFVEHAGLDKSMMRCDNPERWALTWPQEPHDDPGSVKMVQQDG